MFSTMVRFNRFYLQMRYSILTPRCRIHYRHSSTLKTFEINNLKIEEKIREEERKKEEKKDKEEIQKRDNSNKDDDDIVDITNPLHPLHPFSVHHYDDGGDD